MVDMCKYYQLEKCGYSPNPEEDGCILIKDAEHECLQALTNSWIGCPNYIRDNFFDPKPKN